MYEQPFQQPLEVLLARFAVRSDAITARVMGRADGAYVTWASWKREGAPPDAEGPWTALAARACDDRRVGLASGSGGLPDVVLAVPLDAPGRPAGALCGGFTREALVEAAVLVWTAASFAQTMSLCLDDPAGFGRLIGAAAVDPLTHCLNPQSMWESLDREVSRAGRQRTPLTCAFVDLDGFKEVNDEDGHLSGDAVLAAVGTALSASVRAYDSVSRFGGDEFVIVMPNSTEKQARALVERMSANVIEATTALGAPVTASFGIAQWRFDEPSAALLERADRNMLDAKRARRSGLSPVS